MSAIKERKSSHLESPLPKMGVTDSAQGEGTNRRIWRKEAESQPLTDLFSSHYQKGLRAVSEMLVLFLFHLPSRRHGFNPWVGKIPWRRKWQPTPVFFSGKSHGQRRLVGYSP